MLQNKASLTHCQAILNLCAMNLYRTEHETCIIYNDIIQKLNPVISQEALLRTSSRILEENLEMTFNANPLDFHSSLAPNLVRNLKFDSSKIFIENFHQYTQTLSGLLRVPLKVNVYNLDGTFLRTSPFEKEFFSCNFSFQENNEGVNSFTYPIYPGQNLSVDCDLDLQDLLEQEPLLFEIFLEHPSGSRHIIPVKLSTFNENSTSTLTPFEDALSKDSISSQNFHSRFFLVDNVLTDSQSEESIPKIIRFARTMDLLFYRANDYSTGVFLTVIYQNILTDDKQLPEIRQSFRLAYYSSASPFEVPILLGKFLHFIYSLTTKPIF